MKLILNNWLAKVLSLVLALILWSVIRKSLGPTISPSRSVEDRFQFDSSRYGNPKK
jgi:YbbR domain-containing protein